MEHHAQVAVAIHCPGKRRRLRPPASSGSEQAATNRLALHPLEDEVSGPESDCIHRWQCCPRCIRLSVRRNVGGLVRWNTVSFAFGRHLSRPSAQGVDARLSHSVVRTPTRRRVENGLLTGMLLRFGSKVSLRRCFSHESR